MNSPVSIEGIDQVISALGYRNPHSMKYRLIHAIRHRYTQDRLAESLTEIEAISLISEIWETTGAQDEIRSRLKNFSSLKSSVNADLKRLFEIGENPEGVIIGPANVFVMSSEAKDRLLSTLSGIVGADGSKRLQKITEVLSMVRDLLSEVSPGAGIAETQELKRMIKGLSEQVGLQKAQEQEVSGSGGSPGKDFPNGGIEPQETLSGKIDETPVEILEVLEAQDETGEGPDGGPGDELEGLGGEASGEAFGGEGGLESGVEVLDIEEEFEDDLEEIGGERFYEDYEDAQGFGEVKASEAPEVGLPLDKEDWEDYQLDSGEADTEKKRLLAERFDGYLGAMERFYNQYLLISGGRYIVGTNDSGKDFQPEQRVTVQDFYVGKYPVTNGLFEVFVESTGYRTTAEDIGYGTVYTGRFQKIVDSYGESPRLLLHATYSRKNVRGACWFQPFGPGSTLHSKRNHPVVQVSVKDALAFAAWSGRRLATEVEWEAAARAADGLRFPWGNQWMDGRCNVETSAVSDTTPVNHYPDGVNSAGIADTLGTVLEWTSDVCDPLYPVKAAQTYHIAKGGSWLSSPETPLFSRFRFPADFTSNTVGFRCVAD